tara:strand:+ start:4576 stop:4686 length:111 start_codon:yes stop_codon:yes gene_type:complete
MAVLWLDDLVCSHPVLKMQLQATSDPVKAREWMADT